MEDYLQATTVVDTMLTTFDNPYNPFFDFDSWKKWDEDNGYFTSELLAAVIGNTDDVLDEVEEARRHAMAINLIIDEGPIEDVWTVCRTDTQTPIRLPTSENEKSEE